VLEVAGGGLGPVGGGDQPDNLILGRFSEPAAVDGGLDESVQGR
jgi:hypothetical protein